jgi:hypothetical protein
MQRLQNVAMALKPIALMTGRARNGERGEKKQSERETFFFETFCRFLAHYNSKTRRQLSLDSSPTSSDGK